MRIGLMIVVFLHATAASAWTLVDDAGGVAVYFESASVSEIGSVKSFTSLEVLPRPDASGVRAWRSKVQVDCFSLRMRVTERTGHPDALAATPAVLTSRPAAWEWFPPGAGQTRMVRSVCTR